MGRTIPSFRIAEGQEAAEWKAFRMALRPTDRHALDEMLSTAKLYTSASSAAVRASKFEGMTMAIVFHHYKTLAQISGAATNLARGGGPDGPR